MKGSNGHASPRSAERGEAFVPPGELWQSLGDVRVERVRWLFPERVPLHMLSLLESKKGCGKSTMLAALSSQILGGPPLPGCRKEKEPGRVLWLAGEESAAHAVRPRIEAAGADPRGVILPGLDLERGQRRRILLPQDLPLLDDLVTGQKLKLVVGDPYISFVPAGYSMRDEDTARAVLEPLAEWATARGVTIVYTRHLKKGRGGDALDAGLGSVAVGNVARSILRLDLHPFQGALRTLSRVRSNFGAAPPTLTFQLVGEAGGVPHVEWEGVTDLDAEDLAGADLDAGERDAKLDAMEILRGILGKGPVPVKQVRAEASDAGVSDSTLRRAKAELKLRSERVYNGREAYWQWHPPAATVEAAKVTPKRRRQKPAGKEPIK